MKGNRSSWVLIAVLAGLLVGWTLLIATAAASEVKSDGHIDGPDAMQPLMISSPRALAKEVPVRVTQVKGLAQLRHSPEAKWEKVVVGMEIGPKTQFRTGPRSAVVFETSRNREITIDRLGMVDGAEAVRAHDGKARDGGRTVFEVRGAAAQDATIQAPGMTLVLHCWMIHRTRASE